MRRLILGTAGHIDHGKTELVRALTGVDTDRLKEEKERGITIDLGFAELPGEDLRLGVVDVPGHEGFIRNMLAGATGMDVVLLVVAADEGVMPQTREHLAIVSLLGVERMVVALTKRDLVDEEWLDLVQEDVRALLAPTPYGGAPLVATSARTGEGLESLAATLRSAAREVRAHDPADLTRLPVDRVFTVRGTGTVVTGTLWSGTLAAGDRVRVLPGELSARVRGVQVHGRDVDAARAGERTAVALSGAEVDRAALARGHTLVAGPGWEASSVLTVRLEVLPDADWELEHGQRVRVHIGTAELMARLVLLEEETLMPGESGWAQLRLEAPAVARARERLVVRSYSPVSTVGGGRVAEPAAPRRTRLRPEEPELFAAILDGGTGQALAARVLLAGWRGEAASALPVTLGFPPQQVEAALAVLAPVESPADTGAEPRLLGEHVLHGNVVAEGARRLEEAVGAFHAAEPLRAGMPLEALRQVLPAEAPAALADALLARGVAAGRLVLGQGTVARAGFHVQLSPAQERLLAGLVETYRSAALAPPLLPELPPEIATSPDLWPLLRILEGEGRLTRLDTDLFAWSEALLEAGTRVRESLAGRQELGPADFKDVLPVTRKHLLPILAHLDRLGVTVRRGKGRDVPGAPVA